ncbi:MAG: serine/threonine protein kinase, partial [Phormidesmis sp. CAN_BIN36]|nr:serine/threonine protein kinase [Phormidesmis sp. CAN_BIN36]
KAGRQTLLARDLQTQELVVVKLLTFNHEFEWDDLKLFEREAETLKSLNHPAIPRYLDYFELESPTYKGVALVQSYIDAKSLEQHLKAGRSFSEADVQQLGRSLLEILIYLHSQQPPVIHRDIKPSNILLGDRSGNTVGQVYLVDFGSVQTLVAHEGGTITVVGTYGYMPPEQFGGRATPASDLYSLGATLICLATGKHPADLPQTNLQIQFKSSAALDESVADWLEWLTEPALDRRLQSAQEALQVLREGRSRSLSTTEESRIVSSITKDQIFWNAVWRSSWAGAIAGASSFTAVLLASAKCYTSYSPLLINVVLSVIFGGALGLVLGFLNGLLMAALTNGSFLPLKNAWLYRWSVGILTTGFSLAVTSVVLALLSPNWEASPILIGLALSITIAGQLFAQWYVKASRRERDSHPKLPSTPDRDDL